MAKYKKVAGPIELVIFETTIEQVHRIGKERPISIIKGAIIASDFGFAIILTDKPESDYEKCWLIPNGIITNMQKYSDDMLPSKLAGKAVRVYYRSKKIINMELI